MVKVQEEDLEKLRQSAPMRRSMYREATATAHKVQRKRLWTAAAAEAQRAQPCSSHEGDGQSDGAAHHRTAAHMEAPPAEVKLQHATNAKWHAT